MGEENGQGSIVILHATNLQAAILLTFRSGIAHTKGHIMDICRLDAEMYSEGTYGKEKGI